MNAPLRPAPIALKSIERLEAWLRYSKTIGINLFYLNRAYSAAPAAVQIAGISGFSQAPRISAASEVPAASGAPEVPKAPIAHRNPATAISPAAAAPIFKDARKAAPPMVATPLPIIAAPSFFDSKVEGD